MTSPVSVLSLCLCFLLSRFTVSLCVGTVGVPREIIIVIIGIAFRVRDPYARLACVCYCCVFCGSVEQCGTVTRLFHIIIITEIFRHTIHTGAHLHPGDKAVFISIQQRQFTTSRVVQQSTRVEYANYSGTQNLCNHNHKRTRNALAIIVLSCVAGWLAGWLCKRQHQESSCSSIFAW